MKKLFLILIAAVFVSALFAEEHHQEINHTKPEKHKQLLAIYTGFTHISSAFYEHETHEQSTGKWVPTIGIDYFYSLTNKWSVGFVGDMEFDNYIIRLEDGTEEERLNVVIASLVAGYKVNHHLGLFGGPGIEMEFSESTKNFFVVKVGVEYEIDIAKGWEIAPNIMYDWKQEYQTFAYGFSIGKKF